MLDRDVKIAEAVNALRSIPPRSGVLAGLKNFFTGESHSRAYAEGWNDCIDFLRAKSSSTPPDPAQMLTDDEIFDCIPPGVLDCLADPYDMGASDGDVTRSIKSDVLRIARAIEARVKGNA